MNKLKLFRIIGENQARVYASKTNPSDQLFTGIAADLYPLNLHRREWALSNMQMFYKQEAERIVIMNRLQNRTTGDDIIAEIRRRKAAGS